MGGGGAIPTYIIRGNYKFEFDIEKRLLPQVEKFESEMKTKGIEFRRVKEYEEFLDISPMINHVEIIC